MCLIISDLKPLLMCIVTSFAEYLSSVIAKLSKENSEYRP